MNERRRSLLKEADKVGCDALVAFRPENVFYMTGFWGEAAAMLAQSGKPVIAAPELEVGRAAAESEDCEVVVAERIGPGPAKTMIDQIKKHNLSAVCTDCQDYQMMTFLASRVPGVRQTQGPFYASRMKKDAGEIRTLRRASGIIDDLFELCSQRLREGLRESELQAVLMAEASAREAFDIGYASTLNPLIIAGGPNGAMPHAQVSGRKFRRGDLVVVDLTLRYRGYVSDATRTFAVGRAAGEACAAYETVRESQLRGLRSVRPGISCKRVDAACREYIEEQGSGEYFIHSTGHGIGLEVHEPPAISSIDKTRLRGGMAITVEPGIYVAGKFGIRIEDSLLVRQGGGPDVLHKFTKDLISV